MPRTDENGRQLKALLDYLLDGDVDAKAIYDALGTSSSTYYRRVKESDYPAAEELRLVSDRFGLELPRLAGEIRVDEPRRNNELRGVRTRSGPDGDWIHDGHPHPAPDEAVRSDATSGRPPAIARFPPIPMAASATSARSQIWEQTSL